jgi:uncharacterized protein (TIGR03083 family)
MSKDVTARRDEGLRHQDTVMAQICETAGSLDEGGWGTPTNCPPWDVKLLIAHMTRGAESFMHIVTSGLQGVTDITTSREERERRQRELAGLSGSELLATFQTNQATLRDLMAGLSAEELGRPGRHPWAVQPLWWFVDQRLAELAFHNWDLDHSLGREREIDSDVARYLMPTIIERNVRAFHRPSPASYGHWVIRATDLENGSWLVEPDDGGVAITRKASEGDPVISSDSAGLIRWFYGRADLEQLEQAGRAAIEGARYRISAWKDMFPAP